VRHEFTAVLERGAEWWVGFCPEVPGANGQGLTREDCLQNLAEAVKLILEDYLEDGLRDAPLDAIREVLTIA
jgi:predicted RNase H-like HicB family nuclease